MARLRGPEGCPWDREQTHRSLARHLLEEAHEVLDAIDADDRDRLREELGDLLLQVVFHARIAADDGAFDVDDVAEGIVRKLVRRHPHVFGDVEVSGADEVLRNWERIKAEEKGEHGVEHDIPETLPALARAAKVLRRVAGTGPDPSRDEALAELRLRAEALGGVDAGRAEEAVGELLLAAAAAARALGVDAEAALRRAVRRFAERHDRTRADGDPPPSGESGRPTHLPDPPT
jgi:MazG family protein